MAWIQLLFFSFLFFTSLISPSRSEKDLLGLKEIKLSCKDVPQETSLQVAALQNQLDSIQKKLKGKATGPAKIVLNILQHYVKAQKLELDLLVETEPKKIEEMQKQMKKLKADLETWSGKIHELQCPKDVECEDISELLGRNWYLENKIKDTLAECNDLQTLYMELLETCEETEPGTGSKDKLKKCNDLKKSVDQLEEELKQKKDELTKLKNNNAELMNENKNLQKEVKKLQEDLDSENL